jgi:D-alanyl-D-alanine carboxypeptidase (penicillin-binding protein 5/6)
MRPRFVALLLAALLFTMAQPVLANPGRADSRPPDVEARGAILIDADTGQILFQKSPNLRLYPASTTKILTVLVAAEKGKLDDLVTISRKAANQEGSSAYLLEGETQRLEDLLYAALVQSGNDAAMAIAEHIGGSEERFAELMNLRAREIGAEKSNFENPHGLFEPDHYTTASDLAKMSRVALQNPIVARIAATKKFTLPGQESKPREFYNHNRLLFRYEGTIGLKNGYTTDSGHSLVGAARRNDQTLIGVVLGDNRENVWTDVMEMFDFGFENFKLVTVVSQGEVVGQTTVERGTTDKVPVITKEPFSLMLKEPDPAKIQREVVMPAAVTAPVQDGSSAGELRLWYDGKLVGKVALVFAQTVAQARKSQNLKALWYALGAFLVFRLFVGWRRRVRRRRRRMRSDGFFPYYRTLSKRS